MKLKEIAGYVFSLEERDMPDDQKLRVLKRLINAEDPEKEWKKVCTELKRNGYGRQILSPSAEVFLGRR